MVPDHNTNNSCDVYTWLSSMMYVVHFLAVRHHTEIACCTCSTSKKKLGCNAQLIVDEFGEKLLEELDYLQEARNIQVRTTVTSPHFLYHTASLRASHFFWFCFPK